LNAPFKIKLKTCNECGDKFSPPNSIRKVCFKYECQAKFMEKHVKNAERLREKRERQALREAKERIKPRSKWLKDAQSVFNRFIRLRDATLPCISCGRFHTGQYHAGHYKPSGSNPELRFNELNVHKQCAPCNNYLSGNLVNYRVELVKRIGLEQVEWLEGKHELPHLSIPEIKQLIAHYKGKCKELLTKER
jgi:hypothetical protein